MSLLDLLGTGKSIQQAQDAAQTVVQQLAPILQDVENRGYGIADSLMDRLNGAEIVIPEIRIKINLKPSFSKAQPVT